MGVSNYYIKEITIDGLHSKIESRLNLVPSLTMISNPLLLEANVCFISGH